MITEEMLALAAGEVSAAMVASVEAVPHVFSRGFERKLHRLNRRAEHPVRYQVLRHVAAVLIAVITVFGALFAASPTVRAAVIGWVRSTFGSWIQYSTEETTPPDVQYDYCLPDEIDGYTLVDKIDRGSDYLYIYLNNNGEMLTFEYLRGENNPYLFVTDVNEYVHQSVPFMQMHADIYLSTSAEEASMIIWNDPKEGILFCISVFTDDTSELIELAKKVEKVERIVKYDYYLSETFDGYTLLTTVDTEDGKLCMYANELGEMLRFQYIYGSTDLSLYIYDVENHNYIRSSVGDYPADIYITSDPEESNLIVWSNNAENVLFYVSAYADMNELLEIANSVKKR